ncbi:MAG: tyrosine-type recombinase/integrase [Clostridia bacterium]
MAAIVKRGKTYSIISYEGEGKNRHQVWESGLSYNTAKARKAQLEYEAAQNTHIDRNDLSVSEFLYEFVEKYGEKKWVASTYDGNVGLLENYVHPYLGDQKLRGIRTKAVDDYYHFLLFSAEPAANAGKPKREKINPSLIHDIHKVLRCAFNQAVKWEYIAKNPFLNATLPEHKEKKRDALTPEQLHRMLEFTDRPDIYDYYMIHCAMQLAFACSMRGGEVGGAQWDRYDAENHMLYIDRVVDRVDKTLIDKLPKMEIKFRFPNMFPGTRTVIVLKQPKTEGSIRNVYTPDTVTKKLLALRRMQEKLKVELGNDSYMDYGLIICQANGRPIMTEHLNKRFKEVLVAMGDPDIDTEGIVFHSIRHTSAGLKLKISKGDVKAVQGDGGWNTPDMVTKRYAHILDEDRRSLAEEMEAKFYQSSAAITPDVPPVPTVQQQPEAVAAPVLDENALASLIAANPSLLIKVLQSVQFANKA